MIFLLYTGTSILFIYIYNILRTQQYTAVMYNYQVFHDKTLFKGCHVKTYQKGQSLTCRPSSQDRTDGEDLRLCLLLESAKTSTMALTVVTKRITPSVMFIDLGFAFIYLKTNPVIRSKNPKR